MEVPVTILDDPLADLELVPKEYIKEQQGRLLDF
jgi:hypothetical protein